MIVLSDLYISIADWTVHLNLAECDNPVRQRLVEHYQAFLVSPSSGKISIRLQVELGDQYIPLSNSPVWQVRTTEQNGRIEFLSHFEKGWVDRVAGRGELVLRPQGDPENFLRVLYAWLCLDHDGLLLHASGIISKGKGYAFVGHSSSGKTTTTLLSSDKTILSDDMVIVKKDGDRYKLYGVPFRGDMPESPRTNAVADLRCLFRLVKDSEHRLEPIAASEAVGHLASCVPFVMTHPDQSLRVLEICADLVKHVPVYALHFRRDPGFWEKIDELD